MKYTDEQIENLKEAVTTWRTMYQQERKKLKEATEQIKGLQMVVPDQDLKHWRMDFAAIRSWVEKAKANQMILTARMGHKMLRYCGLTWKRFLEDMDKNWSFRKVVERETGYTMEIVQEGRQVVSSHILITGRYEE